ncbi:hypothetical protein PISL3812_02734 [Talaromyces islandicus]|uniref:RING-type E3 ubiquitin transferase n=1 Tax=Talaromyces islandicus TaxID=28573 RepID=A0A0U1LQP7_TALIS|nr:hypothetical protein PISL3812_02734 [Talaromyces islandicus]
MRPPRLLLLIFCFIFLPILLTFLSLVTAEPRRGADADAPIAGRSSRLRALFSFNAPTSLFPPSAIISLTDDNSTFFLARPAAFGPLLPTKGLSGQLWIGSGFSEDTLRRGAGTAGSEGELGCSDVPGWDKDVQSKQDKTLAESGTGSAANSPSDKTSVKDRRAGDTGYDSLEEDDASVLRDGTDDYLHRPFIPSSLDKAGDKQPSTHADIQSLQESAEIAGKIVLLSRGGCGFLEKVKWVQRRGGSALIVGDDTKGGSLVTMYARGDTSNVTIPSLFTSYTTAHLLSSLVTERTFLEVPADVTANLPPKKQKQSTTTSTTTTTSTSFPTSTSINKKPLHTGPSESGFFSSFLSKVGLGTNGGSISGDSRRPPSSGNIDWVLVDKSEGDDSDSGYGKPSSGKSRAKKNEKSLVDDVETNLADGDGFEIGVHDWRDPDLLLPKQTSKPESSSAGDSKNSKKKEEKADSNKNANLQGGSITPGSGEYSYARKPNEPEKKKESSKNSDTNSKLQGESSHKGWWLAQLFVSNEATDGKLDRLMESRIRSQNGKDAGAKQHSADHDGLWVTLTPTRMSTNPFFDTLLVLVVSPLITLTVVYALLLLRSRIRRRRWRAPKSVVERLPIRTYHTITSQSTTTSSTRSPSPGSVASFTSTSPLLSSGPVDTSRRPRPRSQTVSGSAVPTDMMSPNTEKSHSSSDLWRRKYIGRQVECVVCLEEYVDGQSQVMSLPCGHEFHADCITPWLTTRRRTCPICKGDVVRSMAQRQTGSDSHSYGAEPSAETHTAAVPIVGSAMSDTNLEEGDGPDAPLLSDNITSSAPQSSWRNFTSMNFSALSGDTVWHSARADRTR